MEEVRQANKLRGPGPDEGVQIGLFLHRSIRSLLPSAGLGDGDVESECRGRSCSGNCSKNKVGTNVNREAGASWTAATIPAAVAAIRLRLAGLEVLATSKTEAVAQPSQAGGALLLLGLGLIFCCGCESVSSKSVHLTVHLLTHCLSRSLP